MKKIYTFLIISIFVNTNLLGQEVVFNEIASLEQVYMDAYESETLLPMNDLDIDFGYILYQAEIGVESEDAILELENVRDYAAVYVGGKLQGTVTDNNKKLILSIAPGKYSLQLYAENIGRITYGPEILDNLKGLFGSISLDGGEIENWKITPLNIKDHSVSSLIFEEENGMNQTPSFYRGSFDMKMPIDVYLDISGWGMGEIWINDIYMGSYWEEEKQQSIQISSENLIDGKNEIVVFDLKNNQQKMMKFTDKPVFK